MPAPLITKTASGLFCEAGDFHIDAWGKVDRNILTHGHSDHARPGATRYLCSTSGKEIIRHRLGKDITLDTVDFGEVLDINGVRVSLHPAGHLLGSAQIRVEKAGEVWVVTGDYKIEPDETCEAFELVPCHTIITECTFGLPIYRWRSTHIIASEINQWWRENQSLGLNSIIVAYSLGKAQRVLKILDDSIGPILLHGATHAMTQVYRDSGVALPATLHATAEVAKEHRGKALIIAPGSAIDTSWARKLDPSRVAAVSGWMSVRGHRRRAGVDRGFVLSDHVDWPGLHSTLDACGASHIIATHGFTGPLVRYLQDAGRSAEALETRFGSEDRPDAEALAEPAAEAIDQPSDVLEFGDET